jgi:hypothetical protein
MGGEVVSPDEMDHIVQSTVAMFLQCYGKKGEG